MTAREAIEYALAKAKKAKEEKSKGTEATAAAQDAAVATDGNAGGGVSAESLAEHDNKYHDGHYKGGKCKFRTDHGIATTPAPEGAEVTSTGEGEESVATKEETSVDTADKNKGGGDNAQTQTQNADNAGGANAAKQSSEELSEVEKKVAQALEDGVDESTLPTEDEVAEQDVVSKDGAGTKDDEPAKTDGAQNQNADNAGGDNANAGNADAGNADGDNGNADADAGNADNAGGADNGGQDGGTDNGGNADANANADGGDNGGNAEDGSDADNIDGDQLNAWETEDEYSADTALPPETSRNRHMAQIDRMVAKELPMLQAAGFADSVTADDVKKEYDAILSEIKAYEGSGDHEVMQGIRKKIDEIYNGLQDKESPQSIDIATGKPVEYDDGFGVTFHTTSCEEKGDPLYLDDDAYDKRTALFATLAKSAPQLGVFDGEREISYRCADVKRAIALCVMFEQKATFNYQTFRDIRNTKFNRGVNALKRYTAEELAE